MGPSLISRVGDNSKSLLPNASCQNQGRQPTFPQEAHPYLETKEGCSSNCKAKVKEEEEVIHSKG